MAKLAVAFVQLFAVITLHAVSCLHREERSLDVMTNYFGPKPRDCAEVQAEGNTENGVYHVFVGPNLKPIRVFCDLTSQGGGWLVFQRRQDGYQDFQQNWNEYAEGFGDLFGEFWLGNHHLHLITQQKQYRLRVDLGDFENNTRFAEYSTMTIDAPFKKYILRLGAYSGDAGNAMAHHSNRRFSTIEQDNDDRDGASCASRYRGGWWYRACHFANPNGLYLGGEHTSYANGVNWQSWRGHHYSLKTTAMKLRPVNFIAEGNVQSGGN